MHDIILFFGAGASVDAGIPTTIELVDEFKNYVENRYPANFLTLKTIIAKLEESFKPEADKDGKVDIETLLEALNIAIETNKIPLLSALLENLTFKKDINVAEIPTIQNLVEDFIRNEMVVTEKEKLSYLKEILNLEKPIEIFTVNYDTCMENVCKINNIEYTDGFDYFWNPSNFESNFGVKLFKLHGSVIWYVDEKNTPQKIPVIAFNKDNMLKLRTIDGLELRPFLLYPAQKPQITETMNKLQSMFEKRLKDANTKIMIIVGYSFRDDYLKETIVSSGFTNENLYIFLIDPDAFKIYENKLRYRDSEKKISSPFENKVIYLPYPFKGVISHLKSYLEAFNRGLLYEKKYLIEAGNERAYWKSIIHDFMECEFFSHVIPYLERFRINSFIMAYKGIDFSIINSCYKGFIHSKIAGDNYTTFWLDKLNELLGFIKSENLDAFVFEEGFSITFNIDYEILAPDGRFINCEAKGCDVLGMVSGMVKTFNENYKPSKLSDFEKTNELFEKLQAYLKEVSHIAKEEGDYFENWRVYLNRRENLKEEIEKELHKGDQLSTESKESIRKIIVAHEKRELDKILNGKSLQITLPIE